MTETPGADVPPPAPSDDVLPPLSQGGTTSQDADVAAGYDDADDNDSEIGEMPTSQQSESHEADIDAGFDNSDKDD